MADEKPLHIQVAEALGWDTSEFLHDRDEAAEGYSQCTRCGSTQSWEENMPAICCPRYDTDWAATGPLIEKYGITLRYDSPDRDWRAYCEWTDSEDVWHATPLLAVCHLLIALGKAGKLEALAQQSP